MEYIDVENWKRNEHFNFFHQMDYPHFNICGNVDITHFLQVVKEKKISFYYAMIYAATAVANEIVNFRYRIRDHQVVLHDKIHPSFTYLDAAEGDLFKIVAVEMEDELLAFVNAAAAKAKEQKAYFHFNEDATVRDDLLYITSVPWIAFTSLSHTISFNKNDSAPRVAWGKYFMENDKMQLPLSVQVNHALVDGVHIGNYFSKLQAYLDAV